MKNMAERHRQRAEAIEAGRVQAAATMAEHKRLQQERIREAQARKNGEIVEEPKQKWFVGVQFHPEFKSRPNRPHPVFEGFVRAAIEK